jgi:CheY-like chemotaxis protein
MRQQTRRGEAPAGGDAGAGREGERALLILVIEDNADAAEALRDLLELFGHRAEIAHSGPDGVAAARRLRPDLVLCDLGLPGMNGLEVARALRGEPPTRHARLVALTGYSGDDDRARTREAGFDLHLVKPIDPEELRRLLAEWAAGSS